MRFIWITALKDLRILRREPFSVAAWVGIPLCVGLLIQMVFGGGQVRPRGVLLIADEDQTIASRMLTSAFSSRGLGKMITVEAVDEPAGRARINRGDGSALLLITPGLQEAFLNNRPYRLQLFTNAGQRILPGIIEESLKTMVESSFYVQRVGAQELRSLNIDSTPTEAETAATAVRAQRLVTDLSRYFSPPLIEVEAIAEQEVRRNATAGDLFFPNLIFLSLMLMANGLSMEIWKERSSGTLRRVAVSPSPVPAFLAGRMAMVTLVYAGMAVAAVVVAKYLAGVTVTNLAAAIAWAAGCGTVFYMMLLPMALTSTAQRGADVRGNLLVFPLAMVGGCFFPFDMMPDWLVRIGRWTPNGMAVMQFRDLLRGTADARQLMMVFAALATVGLLCFWLCVRRLKGGFLI